MKTFNKKLKKNIQEVFFLEPNDLGYWPLTNLFKKTTKPLKVMPFIIVVPLSLTIALAMYFVFGALLVKLVSLLQYGF